MGDVDITLPSGEAATVPQADLAQAIAAGATPLVQGAYEKELGGGLGQAASFAFGAGRTASFGAMDGLLVEGANIIGGESARADMLHGLNVAKETNPYATMGGEAAGLFVGAGKGVMAAGASVEGAVAQRVGTGLLGKMASMGARGAVEGAAIGIQHQISEDTLGDVEFNGEKMFAAAGKDALLGGAIGGGIGAISHAGAGALGLLGKARGPRPAALLDEVAGIEGGGVAMREDLKAAEELVGEFRKVGYTSEQGALAVDEISALARGESAAGEGFLGRKYREHVVKPWAKVRAGGDAETEELYLKGYQHREGRILDHDARVGTQALELKKAGSELMRVEETLNDINFTQRPEQFAKLLPPDIDKVADAVALMTQKVDDVVSKFEQVRTHGGEAVQVLGLRKMLTSVYAKQAGIVEATTEAARASRAADLYMGAYHMKQELQKLSGFGKLEHRLTPTEGIFRKVADELRVGLEDEVAFGPAGAANREWNETFSQALPRRGYFQERFGVSIDAPGGVPRPEVDFEKSRNFLKSLSGNQLEDDALQGTISAGAFTDGIRARLGAVSKHANMTAAERAMFEKGHAAADAFDAAFAAARKESGTVSKLRKMALEEQNKSLGGVLGLATDIITKPLQTMERLADLGVVMGRFEKGIENGIGRFFKGQGADLADAVRSGARPKADVVAEIGELRELAANPVAMESRVKKLLGDVHDYAPKIGGSAAVVALRALTFLAAEAPTSRTQPSMGSSKAPLRFSDSQIASYETKRNAAFHPESVVTELNLGKLNRDGIRTVKVVYPQLFAQMQQTARVQLDEMERKGLLAKMPYQQKAAIASLLQIAPDGTWQPDFMALMQSTKVPQQAPAPEAAPQGGGVRRPLKMNTAILQTEAQQVEGRTT